MINLADLRPNSVLSLYSERKHIKLDPDYQRMGDIWTTEKRQLLVDSILNGFDVPKIYFHKYSRPVRRRKDEPTINYAIVDGRQRLETLWKFIEGDFPLSDDFLFMEDPSVEAGGLTYKEIAENYPDLKIKFDSFPLAVVLIEVDDLDIIEDMFSRLNEAVPLSAAEKRNAFGGTMPKAIRDLSKHPFFIKNLPFQNKRYRHYDLACKFLLFESYGRLTDTKKVYLDNFVSEWKEHKKRYPTSLIKKAKTILRIMSETFIENDKLLRSVGNVVLFYFLIKTALEEGWHNEIKRKKFQSFEKLRIENRKIAETDITRADYELLEFDRYTQTPNDAYALELRFSILLSKAFGRDWN